MPRLGLPNWDHVWLHLPGHPHGSSFFGAFFFYNVCIETKFKLNHALRRTGSILLSQINVDGWVWWCCLHVSSQHNSWTVLFVWLFITPPYTFQNSCAGSQIHYGALLHFYCAVQALTGHITVCHTHQIHILLVCFILFFCEVFYTEALEQSLTLLGLVMFN